MDGGLGFDFLRIPMAYPSYLDIDRKKYISPDDVYKIDEKALEKVDELVHLPIAQSCRGYYPHIISHYKAPWAFKDITNMPELKYPGKVNGQTLGRAMLEEFYEPWIELVRSGVGVHCGECGCHNKTLHENFLAWFGDVTDILGSSGIGIALWNFRGDFGILDSGRGDVDYEDWYGHKLDRKLLDLILKA